MIYLKKYNITIGPEEEAITNHEEYDLIINVSDTPPKKWDHTFWFPIQEMSNWGYSPFYWVCKIFEEYMVNTGVNKTLVHCHAGINRSPSIVVGWLLSQGLKQEQIMKVMETDDFYIKQFQRNIDKNHIPNDIGKFLGTMNRLPDYSMMGLLHLLEHHYAH